MKLDVRSTEIYLRVWRKRLAQYKLYRELGVYILFVMLFAFLAIRVIPINYEQNESLIVEGHLNMEEAFKNIKDAEDVYEWLSDVLMPITDPANAQHAPFREFRRQVGAIRIRQIRSTAYTCQAAVPGHDHLVESQCFHDFGPGSEERLPFGLESDACVTFAAS
eukprot:tig00021036_g17403.t1